MSNKKRMKLSMKKLAYNTPYSVKDEKMAIIREQLIKRYGFIESFDSNIDTTEVSEKIFLSVVSEYKSVAEYRKELREAYSLISNNKQITKEMDRRLTITKQELEQAGLLEKFAYI